MEIFIEIVPYTKIASTFLYGYNAVDLKDFKATWKTSMKQINRQQLFTWILIRT